MEPIGKANLSKEVMKSILETIRTEQFKPGDRLPPIKELSEKLEVGISSIREGLKQLQSMGIIEIVQGKGTFVSEKLGLDQFLDGLKNLITLQKQDFFNVMEARKIIECETARLAANRADSVETEKLETLIANMVEHSKKNDVDIYDELDVEFHIAIAEASRNPVLVTFLKSIQGLIRSIVKEIFALPGQPRGANMHHERIFSAIKKRDQETACQSMSAHLLEVEQMANKYLYKDNE
jgi:GntR family transcriptional repressor for pyruvate dehydrogenase complex